MAKKTNVARTISVLVLRVLMCLENSPYHIYRLYTCTSSVYIYIYIYIYGCETWSQTLREEHRLRVFENRVLRRIFGRKRDEVAVFLHWMNFGGNI
jgi:hypothetical protein